MLPRSDKFYVTLIVSFSVVVVIISVVAAIAAFSGDNNQRPEYESAPDPSLVQLPPETLLQSTDKSGLIQEELNSAPMSDDTYLLLHSSTRKILQALTSKNAQSQLTQQGLSPADSFTLAKNASKAESYNPNTKMSAAGKIDVTVGDLQLVQNPSALEQQSSLQVDTSAGQDFVLVGQSGCRVSEPFSVNIKIHWTLPLGNKGQPAGKWQIEPTYEMPSPTPSNSC